MPRSTPNYRPQPKRSRKIEPVVPFDLARDGLGYFTDACRTIAAIAENEFRQNGTWPTLDRVAYYVDHRLNDAGKKTTNTNRSRDLGKWIRNVGTPPSDGDMARGVQQAFVLVGGLVVALEGSSDAHRTKYAIDSLAHDLAIIVEAMRGETVLQMAVCNAVTRLNRVVVYRHKIDSGVIEQHGVGDSAKFVFVGASGGCEIFTREKAQYSLGIRIVS